MATPVVAGAVCVCSEAIGTGTINPTSKNGIKLGGKPVVCIADAAPLTNVSSCGMCKSMANPAVAMATAAAMGTLTPQQCVPAIIGGWQCSSSLRIGGTPVLTDDGKLQCSYGGTIEIVNPGQATVHT